jgi:hypothetical protein
MRGLRHVQIQRSNLRAEQVLIGEKEPLDWHDQGGEIDELWSSQPSQYRCQPSFYDDGFGNTIRVEEDGLETIVGDTIAVVVVE